MRARQLLSLALDPDVRRAALATLPPLSRLGVAVTRHVARRRMAEIASVGSAAARGRAARRGAIAALAAGTAAGAVILSDRDRRKLIARRLGR